MRSEDEFFVGYLPTPRGLGRFLLSAVGLLMLTALLAGTMIASRQRDPGDGQWESTSHKIAGTFIARPYPMIQLADGSGTLLLVGEGKVAAEIPEGVMDGQGVSASGTILQRGTLRMLELDHALEPANVANNTPAASPLESEPRTFRGEIVDPKCFSGGMKPGDGKTHKACAALCLRGGIPPALITEQREVFILTDPAGSTLSGDSLENVVALVGERIEVRGTPITRGDLRMLRIEPSSLRR